MPGGLPSGPEDIPLAEVQAIMGPTSRDSALFGRMEGPGLTEAEARWKLWQEKYAPQMERPITPVGGPVEAAVTGGVTGAKLGFGAGKAAAMAAMDALTAPAFDELIDTQPLPGLAALLVYGAVQPALLSKLVPRLRSTAKAGESAVHKAAERLADTIERDPAAAHKQLMAILEKPAAQRTETDRWVIAALVNKAKGRPLQRAEEVALEDYLIQFKAKAAAEGAGQPTPMQGLVARARTAPPGTFTPRAPPPAPITPPQRTVNLGRGMVRQEVPGPVAVETHGPTPSPLGATRSPPIRRGLGVQKESLGGQQPVLSPGERGAFRLPRRTPVGETLPPRTGPSAADVFPEYQKVAQRAAAEPVATPPPSKGLGAPKVEAADVGAALEEHQRDLSRLTTITHDPKMGVKARIFNWYGDRDSGIVAGHKAVNALRSAAKKAGWTTEDYTTAVARIEAGEHTPLLDAIRRVHNDWADAWRQFKDSDMPTIENYVRHMWQKPNYMVRRGEQDPHYFYGVRGKAEAKAWAAQHGGEVVTADNWASNLAGQQRQQPSFVKKRVLATESRGRELGLRPAVDNIFDRMEHYNAMMHTVMANNRLAQDVGKMISEDGKPMVLRWSEKAMNTYKPRGYVEVPSLALGKFASGNGDLSRVLVHPDIAPYVRSIYDVHTGSMLGNAYDNLAAVSKASLLSLSMFHAMALTESAVMDLGFIRGGTVAAKGLGGMVKGLLWKEVGTTVKRSAMAEDAIRHGLQMGTPPLVQRARADAAIEAIEKKVFGSVGLKWSPISTPKGRWDHSLWEIYHDALKLTAYEKHVGQWMSKMVAKGMTEDAVKQLVASHVNDAFGGQIWEVANNVMRDPNFRKWMHRIFLAPDWNYSQGKIFLRWLKAGWKPGMKTPEELLNAKLANRYWLRAMILVGGVFQAVNYYNTKRDYGRGYFTWENPGRRQGETWPGAEKLGPLARLGDIYLGRATDPDTLLPVEQYVRPLKQVFEPLDFVANPLDFFERKAHPTWKSLVKSFFPQMRDEWTQRAFDKAAGDPRKLIQVYLESSLGQQFMPIGIGTALKPGTQLYGGIYRIRKGITYTEARNRMVRIANKMANAQERYMNPDASMKARYNAAQTMVGLLQKDLPELSLTMRLNSLDPSKMSEKEMMGASMSRAFSQIREQNRALYPQLQ